MTAKCFYNIIDEAWWVQDEDGFTWGIGKTPDEAIEIAEFWGLDCSNIEFEE